MQRSKQYSVENLVLQHFHKALVFGVTGTFILTNPEASVPVVLTARILEKKHNSNKYCYGA